MIDLLNGNFFSLLFVLYCFQLISVAWELLVIFSMLRSSYFFEKNQKVKSWIQWIPSYNIRLSRCHVMFLADNCGMSQGTPLLSLRLCFFHTMWILIGKKYWLVTDFLHKNDKNLNKHTQFLNCTNKAGGS